MRNSVDLPQPDGPRNTMNSCGRMLSDTLSMTVAAPKVLVTFFELDARHEDVNID